MAENVGRRCKKEPGHKNTQCKYNHFENDEVTIDSWELKCVDCGFRETIAYRSDDSDLDLDTVIGNKCPFCGLEDAKPGKNPCD